MFTSVSIKRSHTYPKILFTRFEKSCEKDLFSQGHDNDLQLDLACFYIDFAMPGHSSTESSGTNLIAL